MLALIYGQVVVGAWFRHFGTTAALWTHVVLAAAVLGHAAGLVRPGRAVRGRGSARLWPSARALAVVVTLQVALGVAALWLMLPLGGNPRTPTLWQAMLRTAHQTNGALLLGSSVVATLVPSARHLTPAPPAVTGLGSPGSTGAGASDRGGGRVKTAVPFGPSVPVRPDPASAAETALADAGGKLAAFVALTKPRITVMVLVTVATGFFLGARGASNPSTLALTVLGTGLVAGGASALNQVLERSRDRLMRRTAGRPLPTGRVSPAEAAVFGAALAVVGLVTLALAANLTAAAVALATLVLYVFVYTPLKPWTTLNTAIGAVPGALPPVIGWAAATGRLGVEAWALFLIVFLWQFPHFLAIAWVYRDDYARGGHKMLPSVDPTGVLTGRQATSYALALVPAGLLPTVVGLAGGYYFVGALVLGLIYLSSSIRFWSAVSDRSARRLMRVSFLYLPAILALLLLNPLPAINRTRLID